MKVSPKPPVRCYSYQRFSSKAQSHGQSITRQSEARDRWLAVRGLNLDESLVMTDAGVSAFKGANRGNPDRNALAAFLEQVKRGKVPRGSFFLIESLDRLSREHIRPALTLLLNLIDAGVRVVQLLPVVAIYDEAVEPMNLMMAIMELSRGHSESMVKSERVGQAWRKKKAKAAVDLAPITSNVPAWLTVKGGQFVVQPGAAETVRLIYRLAAGGMGIDPILKQLKADKIPPFPGVPRWARSSLAKLLASRRTLGEYQPTQGTNTRTREPDGPPIPNYYPPVITEDEWNAASYSMAGRRMYRGPLGKNIHVFAGLLKVAGSGVQIYRDHKGPKSGSAKLVNKLAMTGEGGKRHPYVSFPLDVFESAVLSKLREVKPRDILPSVSAVEEVETLTARRAAIESRVEKIQSKMVAGDEDVSPLVGVIRRLQADLDAVSSELTEAEQWSETPLADAWGEYRTLIDALKDSDDEIAMRLRLRSVLRRMVEEVSCVFVGKGGTRLAAVQVWFRGGRQRSYLILHKSAHGGRGGVASTAVRSFAELGTKDGIDLRTAKGAKLVEKLLAGLEV